MTNLKGVLHKLTPLISLVLFGVAVMIVHHEINVYHWQEIKAALLGIPLNVLISMACLTMLGYFALSLYDYLALEYAGEKLPYRRVLLTSFLGYAISNNVGHALISGGSMRYRLYSGWGISAISIAKVVLFCTLTYLIGAVTLMLIGYTAVSDHAAITQNIPHAYIDAVILAGSVLLLLWWGIILFYRKEITIRGFSVAAPGLSLSLRQLLVALADLLLASLVLYIPLSHYIDMPFSTFLLLYIMAQLIGLFSQVPGGIGVFEGSFLFLASKQYPSSHILAALISYRAVYYFLPLVVAGVVLALYELKAHRLLQNLKISTSFVIIESAIPQLFSVLLLLGGGALLISGATPGVEERLIWLHYILPLPLIEFSHMIGSVTGVMFLFLSRAVWKRMDSAYFATITFLGLGAVASLAKGWASIDKQIGETLNREGIPVVGFNSLQYYWEKKSPDIAGKDLMRILSHYSQAWGATRFILVGYSRGADTLPFMVSRLPEEMKTKIKIVALLGMEEDVDFEFHVEDWLSSKGNGQHKTVPEVQKLKGMNVLCIYGSDENASACKKLDQTSFKVVEMKGGHHFSGDYGKLASITLKESTH